MDERAMPRGTDVPGRDRDVARVGAEPLRMRQTSWTQTLAEATIRCGTVQCLAFLLLHPCQPLYGAQGMVGHGCAFRVGPGAPGAKSQKWPPAKRNAVTESRGQRQGAPRFQQVVSGRGPAPSPEEVVERARVRVAQLEAAVQLLEDPALPPPRSFDESSGSCVGTPVDRPDCFVRVVRCPEEEASRGSRSGYSGSCTKEGPPQDRGRCRGGEVGQVER